MAPADNGSSSPTSASRVIVRVVVWYAAIIALGAFAWKFLPRTRVLASDSLEALFGLATETVTGSGKNTQIQMPTQGTLALTVIMAMLASAALALPVAWIYTLTRSKRGYQQSMVQLLVVLPVVIAGVVVLIKYSIALAFSLGGIVAAVRFRNTLDDSKDAVYVFLVTGLGIAAAVDLPVAMVISVMFNALTLTLWTTDFGRTPVALEGRMAERRLARAKEMARTGTFVARIDDEVFRNMTAEQLEGIAQRAWRRARQHDPEAGDASPHTTEFCLRVVTRDTGVTRPAVEKQLAEAAKDWKLGTINVQADGATVIDYIVTPKKKTSPEDLVTLAKAVSGAELVDAEVR